MTGSSILFRWNSFYYWKSEKEHDIIIFTGDTHPLPGKVPELAGYILEFAKGFGIERLYMPGAFLTDVHHLSQPTIYGSATDQALREYLHSYNIADNPPMNIAHNLNAWLLGMAKSKGIDAVGLVSEIPAYKPDERNVRACRALINILLQMLDIGTLDLSDMDAMIKEEDKLTERRLAELKESNDEKTLDFLHYLEMLEKRSNEISYNRSAILPSDIDLPPSLKFIEEMYARAKSNHEEIQGLRLAVQQLKSSERLLIMRKYGDEIMSLLDYQV
jgi:proteasome assembly chaperone (PAC2) family protein